CNPPHTWKANLITTLGGPAVNVVLVPILGAAVLALHLGWGAVIFLPFDPSAVIINNHITSHLEQLTWWLYYMNLILLLFNMCLPMFPMDAGLVLQELLWPRLGYGRSMYIAVNLGLMLAIVVGVVAYVFIQSTQLAVVALFAGITCWDQRRRLAFAAPEGGA